MSAILVAVTMLAGAGDNIVTSPFLYGGTYNLFRHTLPRLGIEVRISAEASPEAIGALTDGRTKAIFAESMGNPTCAVPDLEGMARVRPPATFHLSSTIRSEREATSATRWNGEQI